MTLMMNKRLVIKSLASLAAALAWAPSSWAQSFPTKPVTLMVPYPPGGLSDVIARMIPPRMSGALGQPVIVENLGGASGGLAVQKVLRAPGDGYYVFIGSPNELILAPLSNASLRFKSEDFRMVQKVGDLTMTILARPDIPASSADELVAYATKRAKEGNPLTYGSVGNGSLYHLLGEKLSQLANVPMSHVPYKGGGPMTQDLIGSRIDIFIGPSGANTINLASSGRVKVLATLTPERVAAFKNVPSVRESKALKEFIYGVWVGLFVKKDTPEAVVQALHKAASAALSDPALTPTLEAQTIARTQGLTLAEAEHAYHASMEQFRTVAKSINLQPE